MILVFLGSWRNTRDRRDLDPAVDLRGHCRPLHDRPDHQPDDARRSCARHRHAGRQRDRRDGEHPPQPDAGQVGDGRDPRRLGRGDPAADGRDAVHLHRVLPGRVPGRAGALPVHPARHHRRAGDAGVLRPVLHGGAGAGAATAEGRASPRRGGEGRLGPADGERVRSRIRAGQATPTRDLLGGILVRRKFVLGCFGVFFAITGALVPVVGTDFFPTADVGILKLHVRAPKGNRLEGTEADHDQGRGSDPRDHPGDRVAHRQSHASACRARSISPSCRATTSAAPTARC